MKRIKLITVILAVAGVSSFGILLIPGLNGSNQIVNYLHYLVWGNRLEVSCDDNLDKKKVKIIFENELALIENESRDRAERLFSRGYNKLIREVIYENGFQINDIPYDYGKQRLSVLYPTVLYKLLNLQQAACTAKLTGS